MTEQEIENERQYQQNEKDLNKAKEVTKVLTDYVNCFGREPKAFIEAFKREHRTLQQSAFRLMLALIEEMATENYHTDGRNVQSKEIAKTLIKGFALAQKEVYINQGESEQRASEYVTGEHSKPSRYLGTI